MRIHFWTLLAALISGAAPTSAQMHHGPAQYGQAPAASPYAGFGTRAVKALSEQQVADLRAGRGMGLALPAELNGYPGPLHVLELADHLALSAGQRSRTQGLFERMKAEAVALGERIIAEETTLDRLFAEKGVTPDTLAAATARIASIQGELRATHLRYHLTMVEVLTPDQVARYNERRGYRQPSHGGG